MGQDMILMGDGKPFPDEEKARKALKNRNLDPAIHEVVKIGDGWAIKPAGDIEDDGLKESGKEEPVKVEVKDTPKKEKFWRVRFHAKSDANQQDNVELSVNGETLLIMRDTDTIIPARFRECAEHAFYIKFRQLPGETRKNESKIMIFPFSIIGEATEAEYKKLKEEGTNRTKEETAKGA